MKYIQDVPKLIEVTNILSSHAIDAEQFYSAQHSFQISKDDDPLIKIGDLFAVANREQRGSSAERLISAFSSFWDGFGEILDEIEGLDGENAHQTLLKWLCGEDVIGTNQKTANLFLKWLVMFNQSFGLDVVDWSILQPYLHVPLDIWLTRLLGRQYLNVGTQDYNKDFLKSTIPNLSIGREKYIELQNELGEITAKTNQPRIILDELWLIGHLFCNYRNILCDRCWIGGQCENAANPPNQKAQ